MRKFSSLLALVLVSGSAWISDAPAEVINFDRMPALTQYSIQINVPNTFPKLSDGTTACEIAISAFPEANNGYVYTNIHYVEDNYPGCHHTLVYTGPNSGGYPVGSKIEGYGQNWVVPAPACPAGYTLIRIYDPDSWICSRPTNLADAAKPAQCTGMSTEVGNPISCSGANKVEHRSDAIFHGFSLEQTFLSSSSSGLFPFGKNWSSILTSRVEVDKQKRAGFVFLEDGKVAPFIKDTSGVWLTQSDLRHYHLSEIAETDGSFAGWQLRIGTLTYIFDSKGRLVRVERLGELLISVVYDATGQPIKLIDRQSREATINYASYMQASSVDLPDGGRIDYMYDAEKRLTSAGSTGDSVGYRYVNSGNDNVLLTEKLDQTGTVIGRYVYDTQGRATTTENGIGGNHFAVAYAENGNQVTVTPPLGSSKEFYFDVFNNGRRLRRTVDACVGCQRSETSYSYGDDGYLSGSNNGALVKNFSRDQNGHVISASENSYDGSHLRTTQTEWHPDLSVPVTRQVYDATNTLIEQSTWAYNARGQALSSSRTDPVAGTTRTTATTYCEQTDIDAGTCPLLGLATSVDGARSDLSDLLRYTYYATDDSTCAATPFSCPHRKGDRWKVTNALGQITEYLAYDGAGRPLSVKDANGIVTDYSYHPRGWLTASKVRGADASSEADDRITRIDYWPTGLVRQVTHPDGAFTAFTYDAAHRLTDITDNAGNTVHYTLDNAGNRVKEDTKDAAGTLKRTLSRVYNQLGQLKTQATAASDPTDFAYDANGNATTVTAALATATQSEYDPLNRLSRTLQDVAGIKADTKFEYDALDNLTKVTDPKGLDTTYDYNGFGELVKLTSPDTGVTRYTYDSAGNRATQTDARGNTTAYSYDALNRLTKVTYPTTSLNVTYTYDVTQTACASGETFSIGRLTKMQDGGAITQYCYNRFGDLVRKVQTSNGTALVLRYDYTVGGQLRRMTYPDGAVVDYVRNAQGQTTQIGVTPAGGSRQVLLGNASYYPFGPAAGWTYGNGRTLARQYDLDYRPQAIQDTRPGGLDVGFGFDPAGNLTALTPAGNPAPEIGLGYDALGRLTALKDGRTGTLIDGYSVDATGNRLSAKVGTATQIYSYPTDSHRLSAVAGVARTYDATGNTTAIGGTARQYTYDTSGRMTQARRAGAVTMNYRYNGKGEQVRRFLGTTNTYTLYDEAGHWLGDYDSNGAPKQQAIWLDDLPVGLLANANKLHYIEPDHLGSPRVVIDPTRDVAVWTWSLKGEAFGNTAPNQDPDGDGAALVLDMRFPGQRFDAASGLNQNYFRDYEAATGRYGQSDPIGLSGGIATYSYTEGSPLSKSDPFGLMSFGKICNSAQQQNIINAVAQMANTIQSNSEASMSGCYDGNCDFKKAAAVMRVIASASFNCNYAQTNGLTVARPRYIFLSGQFSSNPTDPVISSPTHSQGVGCLMSALYHEAMHLALWNEIPDEDDVRRETKKCFDCAVSHTEQGQMPLW
ncbi:RHS repeat-associated core domain-containing protein [Xanthomonas citri pv. malvacearum]|uniref:RHS repeat-associated core domain-containing protein n=1 Tax=Xanthomonas citri TaxID=346 RepID=UPI002E14218F